MTQNDKKYTRSAIEVALKRLEDEHSYGFPEFWDYLEEASEARVA